MFSAVALMTLLCLKSLAWPVIRRRARVEYTSPSNFTES